MIKDNKKKKVLCFDSIKTLILTGHDIQIIRNVPRDFPKKKKRFVDL
jgi:hypothetical protein